MARGVAHVFQVVVLATRTQAGLNPCTSAVFVGVLRLLLWHWMQPAAYFFAVLAYLGDLSGLQLWLAAIVGGAWRPAPTHIYIYIYIYI